MSSLLPMCGIAGLYIKSAALQVRLGELLSRMIVELSDRGPDSAGVAFYRDPTSPGSCRVSLYSPSAAVDWHAVRADLEAGFGAASPPEVRATHATFVVEGEAEEVQAWLCERHPEVTVMSSGRSIEIYKQAGPPRQFRRRFALARDLGQSRAWPHADGDRESVSPPRTRTRSPPGLTYVWFTTARCLTTTRCAGCSRSEGIRFQTDNDTEVAAGYLTWRMRAGARLEHALEGCLEDLDGFYTFAVGTLDGFAALRDPIACKPAVMAETDEWVAMASEFRAIAVLPEAHDAEVWEPEPACVYSWGTTSVA